MKSLWIVLYDLVSIATHWQVKSSSVFCQVNGFFFAIGIEAADAAMFLIALHSTVYIFWPNRAGGDSGLYPYRRAAYIFFAVWPIAMASMAFVTDTSPYVNTGQFCYLPTKPWWFRTALSWIPRYINLLLILLMYSSSYLYIRVMMRRYSRRNSEVPVGRPERIVPPTPSLMAHGLISQSPAGSTRSSSKTPSMTKTHKERSPTRPTEQFRIRDSFRGKMDKAGWGTRTSGTWTWAGFDAASAALQTFGPSSEGISPRSGAVIPDTATIPEQFVEDNTEVHEAPVAAELPKLAQLKRKLPVHTPSSIKSSKARGRNSPRFYHRPLANPSVSEDYFTDLACLDRSETRTSSQVDIKRVLREGPARISDSDFEMDSPIIALDQTAFESGGISRSREKTRRQLRYLFIYPVVYACVWIFPFVNDLSIFDQSLEKHPPRSLALCSLMSLSMQGLADSFVFCAREKPWRHLRGGFWVSFGLDFFKDWKFTFRKDSGRTREEMFNDSQRARSRREEELEMEMDIHRSPGGRRPPTFGGKNWWDAEFEESNQRRDTVSEETGPSSQRRESTTETMSKVVKGVSLGI